LKDDVGPCTIKKVGAISYQQQSICGWLSKVGWMEGVWAGGSRLG